MKVHVVKCNSHIRLELCINEILEKEQLSNRRHIIDIKYAVSFLRTERETIYTAMIIYQELGNRFDKERERDINV